MRAAGIFANQWKGIIKTYNSWPKVLGMFPVGNYVIVVDCQTELLACEQPHIVHNADRTTSLRKGYENYGCEELRLFVNHLLTASPSGCRLGSIIGRMRPSKSALKTNT